VPFSDWRSMSITQLALFELEVFWDLLLMFWLKGAYLKLQFNWSC
jgi:hypothetical protein